MPLTRPAKAKAPQSEGRNLVVMLDGTGNELGRNLSNVLKLFRMAEKSERQLVYYDPGVGTIGRPSPWRRLRQNTEKVLGLAFGYGLDENVLEAYSWLCERWQTGDKIWLFGFSRGAWTARVLGGMIHMIGLLRPDQLNMCDYALGAYKRASDSDDLSIAWHFSRVSAARKAEIEFIGVWDTVASVLVPRPDRAWIPSLETLPYTSTNPSVKSLRHALAIDERRRMFRPAHWKMGQKYIKNPFSKSPPPDQDAVEMWFAGVHSDVGGGYPEEESGLSKFPLVWMAEESKAKGLHINTAMLNHLARGRQRKGGTHQYVKPDPSAKAHRSLRGAWWVLEILPKLTKYREWPRPGLLGLYFPFAEPRRIDEADNVHPSVKQRQKALANYQPKNLPLENPR
ncbi:DUF2235 domain-containing protein [Sphingorhabdus soli]|uniref:DUF2235 domain-containing protein n=1 Tax=Flavisphingopyxis soli TaxID=2601267 RepID=A0A5C6UQS2_9SPHN|nr:DUF2235 domain-containing protein [Sphingorhabdus soli]TXC73375.1 DUF2235 domain-containing protein [Sphingorhabdus soli]